MKTQLIKVSYLVEFDDNEANTENEIINAISKNIEFKDSRKIMKWIETSKVELDSKENCGRCFNCGSWTSDREKDNTILELSNGATVDGKLLCDECLPEEHR